MPNSSQTLCENPWLPNSSRERWLTCGSEVNGRWESVVSLFTFSFLNRWIYFSVKNRFPIDVLRRANSEIIRPRLLNACITQHLSNEESSSETKTMLARNNHSGRLRLPLTPAVRTATKLEVRREPSCPICSISAALGGVGVPFESFFSRSRRSARLSVEDATKTGWAWTPSTAARFSLRSQGKTRCSWMKNIVAARRSTAAVLAGAAGPRRSI